MGEQGIQEAGVLVAVLLEEAPGALGGCFHCYGTVVGPVDHEGAAVYAVIIAEFFIAEFPYACFLVLSKADQGITAAANACPR